VFTFPLNHRVEHFEPSEYVAIVHRERPTVARVSQEKRAHV